ncbi:acyltransferase [Cyclobacterium sp. 1_MG-2023]|uniref:acyltransferase n=1 Tax=Cyclobacterium sp. 1_MG-2023 TaxID=3062681 RepID=UPI0026E2FFDD|nr:acyltransferase [Cyclobacterium sp. 1_MG-2023]MDO6440382.1 acyltransferase [Cyclobacterium sp. 1_MG-2023]
MHFIIKLIYFIVNKIKFNRNKIILGKDPIFNGVLFVHNLGDIKIGNKFKATSGSRYNPIGGDHILRLVCRPNAKIYIGHNVGISNSSFFISNELFIGDNVLIGGGCKIWDSDFHSIDSYERNFNGDNNVISKPIFIDKCCFIGASSIILKGVTIGENSIVGAGSVVTKSIPPNEIWAGNPAKKIKSLNINE